jgi:S1-C subfamily serine protease
MIMKALWTWALLLLTSAMGCSGCGIKAFGSRSPQLSLPETIQQKTVALVEIDDKTKTIDATCAGVWVDNMHILTAAHCVNELSLFNPLTSHEPVSHIGADVNYLVYDDVKVNHGISTQNVAVKNAFVIAFDDKVDLALLETNTSIPKHPIATFSSEAIKTGDYIHIVGHTSTYEWTYSTGNVAMIRHIKGPLPEKIMMIQVAGSVWFGNSGGGAWDTNGQLIGIASHLIRNSPVSFFIHRDVVQTFLAKNNIR